MSEFPHSVWCSAKHRFWAVAHLNVEQTYATTATSTANREMIMVDPTNASCSDTQCSANSDAPCCSLAAAAIGASEGNVTILLRAGVIHRSCTLRINASVLTISAFDPLTTPTYLAADHYASFVHTPSAQGVATLDCSGCDTCLTAYDDTTLIQLSYVILRSSTTAAVSYVGSIDMLNVTLCYHHGTLLDQRFVPGEAYAYPRLLRCVGCLIANNTLEHSAIDGAYMHTVQFVASVIRNNSVVDPAELLSFIAVRVDPAGPQPTERTCDDCFDVFQNPLTVCTCAHQSSVGCRFAASCFLHIRTWCMMNRSDQQTAESPSVRSCFALDAVTIEDHVLPTSTVSASEFDMLCMRQLVVQRNTAQIMQLTPSTISLSSDAESYLRSLQVVDSVFADNTAGAGGALSIQGALNTKLDNVQFWRNTAMGDPAVLVRA